jgi:O-antigen/teichoic acid export membrane protein
MKALRGASINVVAQFLATMCRTVGVIVLARLLKPTDFGLVAMVTAFSLVLGRFGENGFTEFIIQKQAINEQEITSIFRLHLMIATLLAIGFTFFGYFLVYFYSEPKLVGIAAAMASTFILTALSTSHFAILKREMRFAPIAISDLVSVILSILFAISAALFGMGYWAVVIRQLTIPFIMMIAAWILCPWRPSGSWNLSMALPGLRYAIHVYSNVMLGALVRGIDKVLLGKFHGPELLGNYDRAYHIVTLPAIQLLTPLHSVALSTLSRIKADKNRFVDYYGKAVSIVAFPGTLASILVTISAKDLVHLLLGPDWIDAGPVVMAFGPGIAAGLVYGTNSWLHLSLGTPHRWFKWSLLSSSIAVTAFIIAAPFGAVAMATTCSLQAYVLIIPALWYAGRPVKLRVVDLVGYFRAYFFSGISVCILWFSVVEYCRPFENFLFGFGLLNRVIISSCIATLLYVGLVVVVQRNFSSIKNIYSLLTQVFSR